MSFVAGIAVGIYLHRWWLDSAEGDGEADGEGAFGAEAPPGSGPAESRPRRTRRKRAAPENSAAAAGLEIPADEITSPGPLLTKSDRERLAGWMSGAEEALRTTGSLNKAWSSPAMVQIKTWLGSPHKKPVEALDAAEKFRQVLMEGLIHSAELTGPILVKLRENSGVSPDQSVVEVKLSALRDETAARLREIREAAEKIAVSPQNEFGFG